MNTIDCRSKNIIESLEGFITSQGRFSAHLRKYKNIKKSSVIDEGLHLLSLFNGADLPFNSVLQGLIDDAFSSLKHNHDLEEIGLVSLLVYEKSYKKLLDSYQK